VYLLSNASGNSSFRVSLKEVLWELTPASGIPRKQQTYLAFSLETDLPFIKRRKDRYHIVHICDLDDGKKAQVADVATGVETFRDNIHHVVFYANIPSYQVKEMEASSMAIQPKYFKAMYDVCKSFVNDNIIDLVTCTSDEETPQEASEKTAHRQKKQQNKNRDERHTQQSLMEVIPCSFELFNKLICQYTEHLTDEPFRLGSYVVSRRMTAKWRRHKDLYSDSFVPFCGIILNVSADGISIDHGFGLWGNNERVIRFYSDECYIDDATTPKDIWSVVDKKTGQTAMRQQMEEAGSYYRLKHRRHISEYMAQLPEAARKSQNESESEEESEEESQSNSAKKRKLAQVFVQRYMQVVDQTKFLSKTPYRQAQVQHLYRQVTLVLHPDKPTGDKVKFQQMSETYERIGRKASKFLICELLD
jgi:curved DNA-binding protein CbpA